MDLAPSLGALQKERPALPIVDRCRSAEYMLNDKRIKSCLLRFDSSFCVQSAILSALIRSPYSRRSTTAATATAARMKTRTGRRLCQQHQLQRRRNRQRQLRQQPRTTVAKCASWRHVLASHWCRADIEHVDSIQDDAMMTKKTFRNSSISRAHN